MNITEENCTENQCVSCFDTIEKAIGCISCTNNHKLCDECFANQFNSQTDPCSVGEFINNDCKIVCGFCKVPFTDKTIISNISDEQYQQLCKIREDVIVKKTEKDVEQRLEKSLTISMTEKHRKFICEKILTLHCVKCDAAILDFDGCFAIECASCKANFCGWCLGDFSPDAHAHVKKCSKSLCKGSVHGTFEQFNAVHCEKRANDVEKYLASIYSSEEANQVKLAIEKDLADLNINIKSKKQCVKNTNHNDVEIQPREMLARLEYERLARLERLREREREREARQRQREREMARENANQIIVGHDYDNNCYKFYNIFENHKVINYNNEFIPYTFK